MPSDANPVSLVATARAIAAGRLRPSDAVSAALDRLDATETDIRAWTYVDQAGALSAARELDDLPGEALPLRGVPIGVKDIIDVRGMPTECGSPLRRGRIAATDAWLVDRLRRAGAIPLGKTVTTEFAYFAPGPTRNPHNLAHTPGGSSSGSAAAVAAGVVPLALGSQTAGSLTRPAAFCGVAGLVAPVRSLPTTGIAGLSHSLDAPGFLTAMVADLRLVYAVLSGAVDMPKASGALEPDRLRLRVWTAEELDEVDAPMLAALGDVVDAVRGDGAEVGELAWATRTPVLVEAHATVMAYEAARSLAAEGQRPDQLSEPLNALLERGRGTGDEDYRAALATAASARADALALLADADAIIGPAALGAAPRGLAATGTPVLSRPWQLLGLPTVTVPGQTDAEGLPLGIQLIGHPDRVDRLLDVAGRLERLAERTPAAP
jgi:Asp-tRNA(Asn)/Glu-tRNA(Gln) amidotransferase A subunit family amidase